MGLIRPNLPFCPQHPSEQSSSRHTLILPCTYSLVKRAELLARIRLSIPYVLITNIRTLSSARPPDPYRTFI